MKRYLMATLLPNTHTNQALNSSVIHFSRGFTESIKYVES